MTVVRYFGHKLTQGGVRPVFKTSPNNKAELKTVLGIVIYLSRFTPKTTSSTATVFKEE